MKKQNVPETNGVATPAFVGSVKDNIEVITGRRRNKITLPTLQTLTFSATPTQAEYLALNAYVNAWAQVLQNIIARLDG